MGNAVSLARERVWQIVADMSKRLTGHPISPTLDRTINFVVERMPAAAKEIEAEL